MTPVGPYGPVWKLSTGLAAVVDEDHQRFEVELSLRIAVHTGWVVRADMGTPQQIERDAIVGETPNVAARLQEAARPGTLVISASTHDLVGADFRCIALGAQPIRGLGRDVEVFEVAAELPPARLSDARSFRAPFVDRDADLSRLRHLWDETRAGGSATVLIQGEPGIGKSRLVSVFRSLVADAGGTEAGCTCSSFHRTTHLYPIRHLVEVACGIDSRHAAAETVPLLRQALEAVGRQELVGVLADLLGIPPEPGWVKPELDGAQLREVTLSGLIDWVSSVCAQDPLLLVVEDLQWADPSTVELIGRTIDRNLPGLMIVTTAREELDPSASRAAEVVALRRLPPDDLRTMARAVAADRPLDDATLDAAVRRSDGVPLFLEELVRAVGVDASGAVGAAPLSSVPAPLLEPLLARLMSPGIDLAVVQMAATIGQEVDVELLTTVTGLPDDDLARRLDVLVDMQLVEPVSPERTTYRFRHHLLGELAYDTQLLPDRRRRHSAVADVLSSIDIHGVPGDAGAIAYHLEMARRFGEAIDAQVNAARDSIAHGAMTEAVEQLDHALGLLEQVTDDKDRAAYEIDVRQVRGLAAVSAWGYAAPMAIADFERCVDLCDELGPRVDGLPSLMGSWYYYTLHGELDRAEQLMLVDRRRIEAIPGAMGEEAGLTAVRFFRGQLEAATQDMATFLSSPYARDLGPAPAGWPLPDDPVVNVLSFQGLLRSVIGDPEGAEESFASARGRAGTLEFPHGPFAGAYVVLLEIIRDEIAGTIDAVSGRIEQVAAVGQRHGFFFFTFAAGFHAAVVRALTAADGYDDLVAAAAMWRAAGMDVWYPWVLTMVADAAGRHGRWAEALVTLDQAATEAARTGSNFFLAETIRLRGLARLATGAADAGAADLAQAAATARSQGARVFELRALLAGVTRELFPVDALCAPVAALVGADGITELDEARRLLGS